MGLLERRHELRRLAEGRENDVREVIATKEVVHRQPRYPSVGVGERVNESDSLIKIDGHLDNFRPRGSIHPIELPLRLCHSKLQLFHERRNPFRGGTGNATPDHRDSPPSVFARRFSAAFVNHSVVVPEGLLLEWSSAVILQPPKGLEEVLALLMEGEEGNGT